MNNSNKPGRPPKYKTPEERKQAIKAKYRKYNKKRSKPPMKEATSKKPRTITVKKERSRIEQQWQERRKVHQKKQTKFKTVTVDPSEVIRVVIDRKTTIEIKKGEDPVAAKEAYLARKNNKV